MVASADAQKHDPTHAQTARHILTAPCNLPSSRTNVVIVVTVLLIVLTLVLVSTNEVDEVLRQLSPQLQKNTSSDVDHYSLNTSFGLSRGPRQHHKYFAEDTASISYNTTKSALPEVGVALPLVDPPQPQIRTVSSVFMCNRFSVAVQPGIQTGQGQIITPGPIGPGFCYRYPRLESEVLMKCVYKRQDELLFQSCSGNSLYTYDSESDFAGAFTCQESRCFLVAGVPICPERLCIAANQYLQYNIDSPGVVFPLPRGVR